MMYDGDMHADMDVGRELPASPFRTTIVLQPFALGAHLTIIHTHYNR